MTVHALQRFEQPARLPRRRMSRAVRRVRTLAVLFVLLVTALVLFLFPRVVHTQAPVAQPVLATWTVAPGDTLWEIASHYAGTGDTRPVVRAIREANGLKQSTIHPGQVLVIPAGAVARR